METVEAAVQTAIKAYQAKNYDEALKSALGALQQCAAARGVSNKENTVSNQPSAGKSTVPAYLQLKPASTDTAKAAKLITDAFYYATASHVNVCSPTSTSMQISLAEETKRWAQFLMAKEPKTKNLASYLTNSVQALKQAASRLDDKASPALADASLRLRLAALELSSDITGTDYFQYVYIMTLIASRATDPQASMEEVLERSKLLEPTTSKHFLACKAVPLAYFVTLGALVRHYERFNQFDKAAEKAKRIQMDSFKFEKRAKEGALDATEALVAKALGVLGFFAEVVTNARTLAASDRNPDQTTKAEEAITRYVSHASKLLSTLLNEITPGSCIASKKTNGLFDALFEVCKILNDLRVLFRRTLSINPPNKHYRGVTHYAALPKETKLMLIQFELFFLANSRLIALCRQVEEQVGTGASSKMGFYLPFEFESLLWAAQAVVQAYNGGGKPSDALPKLADSLEQHISDAVEVCVDTKQQQKGFELISMALSIWAGLMTEHFRKSGLSYLGARAARLFELCCEVYKQLEHIEGANFDADKLAGRYQLLASLRQHDSPQAAIDKLEEAIRRVDLTNDTKRLSAVNAYVLAKLKSLAGKTEEEVSSHSIFTVLESAVKSAKSTAAVDNIASAIFEEAQLLDQPQGVGLQRRLLHQILDNFCPEGLESRTKYRLRALVALAQSYKQSGASDKALELLNDAWSLYQDNAASLNDIYCLDDLASARSLGILLQLETAQAGSVFSDDFNQRQPRETPIDPQALKAAGIALEKEETSETAEASGEGLEASLQPLSACLQQWTQLMNSLKRDKTDVDGWMNRRFIFSPRRTQTLLESIYSIAVLAGSVKQQVVALKLQIKLNKLVLKQTPQTQRDILIAYCTLGETFIEAGYPQPTASRYFDKAKALFGSFDDSAAPSIEFLLSNGRFLFETGQIDDTVLEKLKSVESQLIEAKAKRNGLQDYLLLSQMQTLLARINAHQGSLADATVRSKQTMVLRGTLISKATQASVGPTSASNRWKLAKSYADSLEQHATYQMLQGNPRMAEYYFKKGLDVATRLEVRQLRCRFLLRLAQIQSKRRQWAEYEKTLGDLDELVAELKASDPTDENPMSRQLMAEYTRRHGDLLREGTKFGDAKDFYLLAEEEIGTLTDDSFVLALDEASLAAQHTQTTKPAKGKAKKSAAESAQGPRLSLAPLADAEAPLGCLPLRRIQIRLQVRAAVAELLEGKATQSLELLGLAKTRLVACQTALNELIDAVEDSGEKENAARLTSGEQALVLYQLAQTLICKFEIESGPRADENYELLWKQTTSEPTNANITLARRGKAASAAKLATPLFSIDIQEAKKHLEQALTCSLQAGSVPKLTADICTTLASLNGSTNKIDMAALVNYSLGLSMRHQMLTSVGESLFKTKPTLPIRKSPKTSVRNSAQKASTTSADEEEELVEALASKISNFKISDETEESKLASTEEDVNLSGDESAMDEVDDDTPKPRIARQSTALLPDSDDDSPKLSRKETKREIKAEGPRSDEVAEYFDNLRYLQSILEFDSTGADSPIGRIGSASLNAEFEEKYVDILGDMPGEAGRHLQRAAIVSATVTPNGSHLIVTRLQYERDPIVIRIPLANQQGSTSPAAETATGAAEQEAPEATASKGASKTTKTSARGAKKTAASELTADAVAKTSRAKTAPALTTRAAATESVDEPEQKKHPSGNLLSQLRDRMYLQVDKFTDILHAASSSRGSAKLSTAEQNRLKTEAEREMRDAVFDLETKLLQAYKFVFCGPFLDEEVYQPAEKLVNDTLTPVLTKLTSIDNLDSNLVMALFSALEHFQGSTQLVGEALARIFNWPLSQLNAAQQGVLAKCVDYILAEFGKFSEEYAEARTVQGWTLPSVAKTASNSKKNSTGDGDLVATELFRHAPVILVLDKHCQALPWESIPILQSYPVSRMPSLAMIRARILQYTRNQEEPGINGIDGSKAFFILNPDGSLVSTEKKLSSEFSKAGWEGVTRIKPTIEIVNEAFQNYDVLMYCGHSGGDQFVRRSEIQEMIGTRTCGPLTILMGCSSVHTRDETAESSFDTTGASMSYVMAGVPALIGNLWSVASKDTDSQTLELVEWLTEGEGEDPESILDMLPRVRSRSKLRYLNGAALVCYGLPVFKIK